MKNVLQRVGGLTPASFLAALFTLVATAILTQWSEVVLGIAPAAEFAIGLPAVTLLALLIGLSTAAGLARLRLLSREETLCVYFITAIAAPMMTQGFWQRVVSVSATIPRGSDMEKYDSISPNLWPHGPNVLRDAVEVVQSGDAEIEGRVTTEANGLEGGVIVLSGMGEGGKTVVRFPLGRDGETLRPGEAVFAGLVLRLSDFQGDSRYSAGFRDRKTGSYLPVAEGRSVGRFNPMLPRGFSRVGKYGLGLPAGDSLVFEVTLHGAGKVELGDLQVFSVEAIEALHAGLQTAPPGLANGARSTRVLEEPAGGLARLLWMAGLGTVPWKDWFRPVVAWGGFAALILLGSFGINAIFRSRWVDGERVQMPLTRIPLMMVGKSFQSGEEPVRFWSNPVMWTGFAIALVWAVLQGWHFYNPSVPDLEIRFPLGPYFGPEWGKTWDVAFSVGLILLALAVFIESGILLSAVVGFLIFRLSYFAGDMTGWDSLPKYPYASYQQIGGFLAYAAVLVWAARRQLGAAFRSEDSEARWGAGMVMAAFLGVALWTAWIGIPLWQALLLLAFLLVVALVSSRFRVEIGTPIGYFTPTNASYLFFLCGGFAVFANDFLLFSYAMSFVFLGAVFFLIPGAQLEFLEVGRRLRIPSGQIWGATALGVLGGVVIGGWIFLLVGYSFGAGAVLNNWSFTQKAWFFSEYTAEMARAGSDSAGGNTGEWLALAYGAGGTLLIATLRQWIAGFWLHPFGFIVGATPFMQDSWGTFLVAWGIRSSCLKLGGVRMLRHGLQPFFGGAFLGGAAAWLIFVVIGTMVSSAGAGMIYQRVP